MSSAASRFRRLPPPRLDERARPAAGQDELAGLHGSGPPPPTPASDGDLFAHFGVALEQSGTSPTPTPIVAARACPSCGWWQRLDRPPSCEVCGHEVAPA